MQNYDALFLYFLKVLYNAKGVTKKTYEEKVFSFGFNAMQSKWETSWTKKTKSTQTTKKK